MNPPYMHVKYHWITPDGLGDMLIQKLGFLRKLKKSPNFGLLRNSLRGTSPKSGTFSRRGEHGQGPPSSKTYLKAFSDQFLR